MHVFTQILPPDATEPTELHGVSNKNNLLDLRKTYWIPQQTGWVVRA